MREAVHIPRNYVHTGKSCVPVVMKQEASQSFGVRGSKLTPGSRGALWLVPGE